MFYAFALCLVPIIAVLLCFILLEKEFSALRGSISCILGLIALIPIEIILIFASRLAFFSSLSQGAILLRCLVLNGIVEEGIKMAVLAFLPAKKMKLREFFCCSILCGLSLGCFETLLYLINGQAIVLRLFTAVVVHTTCAALGGLFIFCLRKNQIPLLAPILAVLTHTVYNYFAGFEPPVQYFSFAVILFAFLECRIQYVGVKSMENLESNEENSFPKQNVVLSLFSRFLRKNEKNQNQTKIESENKAVQNPQESNQEIQSEKIAQSKEVSLDDFTSPDFVGVDTEDGLKDYAKGLPKIEDLFKDDLELEKPATDTVSTEPKPRKKRSPAKKSETATSSTGSATPTDSKTEKPKRKRVVKTASSESPKQAKEEVVPKKSNSTRAKKSENSSLDA